MNPTQEQINTWIEKARRSVAENDLVEFSVDGFIDNPKNYFVRFLLEMRVQIERWDLLTDYLFVHPNNLKFLVSYLGDYVDWYTGDTDNSPRAPKIWGTQMMASDKVPTDILIGFSKDGFERVIQDSEIDGDDGRYLVLGLVDYKMIERLNKIKTFW